MKIKKYSIVIALAMSLLLVFTACAVDDTGNENARRNNMDNAGNNMNNTIPGDMTGDGFQNENPDRNAGGTDEGLNQNQNTGMTRPGRLTTSLGNLNNENSENLSRQISDLPEVNEASVVINDNRAVVGIQLTNNQRQNEISSALRNRIEDMVRDTNREIDDVSITADDEIYGRIETMSNEMLNDTSGNFFQTIGNQFDELIDAITPNLNNNRTTTPSR